MIDKKWFIDRREGLHCCTCNERNTVLYNNKFFRRIVCEHCLPHVKEMITKVLGENLNSEPKGSTHNKGYEVNQK
jgi:hypothetical protein